jgi:hypothetical protein
MCGSAPHPVVIEQNFWKFSVLAYFYELIRLGTDFSEFRTDLSLSSSPMPIIPPLQTLMPASRTYNKTKIITMIINK